MLENVDFFIVSHYLKSDGENIFGPDVYLIKASSRKEIVKKINEQFPGQALSIKFEPVSLGYHPRFIGTLVRKELLD